MTIEVLKDVLKQDAVEELVIERKWMCQHVALNVARLCIQVGALWSSYRKLLTQVVRVPPVFILWALTTATDVQ
jgi:hypothetical protein